MPLLYAVAFIVSLSLSGFVLAAEAIYFDVGNDSWAPWEWSSDLLSGSNQTPDFSSKLNTILSQGCWCRGCFIDSTTSECVIPLGFHSDHEGRLTVSRVNVTYNTYNVLRNVTYGDSFVRADGCDWNIEYYRTITVTDTVTQKIPLSYDGVRECYYNSTHHSSPGSNDAVNDAVYRLLSSELDPDGDGVVNESIRFNEYSMRFRAEGLSKTASLWGPVLIKLIVWL